MEENSTEENSTPRRFPLARMVFVCALIVLVGSLITRDSDQPDLAPDSVEIAQVDEEVLGPTLVEPDRRDSEPSLQTGPKTFEISTKSQWDDAVAAASPGDTLRLVQTINQLLDYEGNTDGGDGPGASGLPGSPITITADPGVWIDPGNQFSNQGALDIKQVDHVHVVGVNIRNSQFGLRLLQVRGSASHPVIVADNVIRQTGHNGLKVGAQFQTVASSWSSHILIEGNTVSDTGQTVPRFGEGIYLGKGGGSYAWLDESHDITVRGNEIFNVTAEAIDVKPGTRDIIVEDNLLHDLAPIDGGAISAHYSNFENPKPNEVDSLIVRGNRIWNLNLDNVSEANDWAIWVGQGGVTIEDNVIWGLRSTSDSIAVRIKSPVQFGPHPIVVRDNTFWTTNGALALGTPSGESLVEASGNTGSGQGLGQVIVSDDHFVGPVPSAGSRSSADAGSGPGTAFAVVAAATPDPEPTPPTTVSPAEANEPAAPTSSTPTSAAPITQPSDGDSSAAANPSTTQPESATTQPESATTQPESATTEPASSEEQAATIGAAPQAGSQTTVSNGEQVLNPNAGLPLSEVAASSSTTAPSSVGAEPVGGGVALPPTSAALGDDTTEAPLSADADDVDNMDDQARDLEAASAIDLPPTGGLALVAVSSESSGAGGSGLLLIGLIALGVTALVVAMRKGQRVFE